MYIVTLNLFYEIQVIDQHQEDLEQANKVEQNLDSINASEESHEGELHSINDSIENETQHHQLNRTFIVTRAAGATSMAADATVNVDTSLPTVSFHEPSLEMAMPMDLTLNEGEFSKVS